MGENMKAKEMFKSLGYKQTINSDNFIDYINDSHGDGDFKYVSFRCMLKEYQVSYYDGYETLTPTVVSIKEHEAITKQMKELGWI